MTDRSKLQTITLAGEEYVVVPRADYDALRSAAQDKISDNSLLAQVLADPDEEWVRPMSLRRKALRENPVRVWRTYRGMKAGVAASYLSDIESSKKPGSVSTLKRIAAALDDLA